jgi:hypothetical protein
MLHPIQHRQHYRAVPHGRRYGRYRTFQVVGLAGQQDEIVPAIVRQSLGSNEAHWASDIAERAFYHQPIARKLCGPTRPDDKSYIGTGFNQSATEISADAAGP